MKKSNNLLRYVKQLPKYQKNVDDHLTTCYFENGGHFKNCGFASYIMYYAAHIINDSDKYKHGFYEHIMSKWWLKWRLKSLV